MDIRYLEHHGIKGQKWGVRRFQNPDGSYTSSGKKRYGIGDKIFNSYVKNQSDFYRQEMGMTKKEADEAAKKKADLAKKIAIGAGVAVGAAAAIYIARRIGRSYLDTTLAKGTLMQTIHANADRVTQGEHFYTSFRNADNKKYIGLFGKQKNLFGVNIGNKLKINYNAKDKIKIAGSKNGKKAFNELMKNNSEFRNLINNPSDPVKQARVLGIGKGKYANFISNEMMDTAENSSKARKIFFENLKSHGYSGVKDINDNVYSNFNTKAAIIFDKTKISDLKIQKLTDSEITKEFIGAQLKVNVDELIKPHNVAAGSALIAGGSLMEYDEKEREKRGLNY